MAADIASAFSPLVAVAERSGLADFLRWWRGELAAMMPAGWRERLASRDTAYLCADGNDWVALRLAAGRVVQGSRVNVGALGLPERRNAFRRLLSEEPGAAGNVWLVLPPESVLVREVRIPLAAEDALRDAIAFDLDRLTPLPAEHAWFDYRLTARDTASQRLTVTLAVTARPPVEKQLAELRELGATILGIGVMDDIAGAPEPFNLLPPEKRDRPATSRETVAARALALAAAMLALAALVYPIWLKRETVITLLPRMEKAHGAAVVAERVAKEIEKLASEHNFILTKKQGQHAMVSIVETVSRLLPDDTWVQQLDVKSGAKLRELQVAGETGSSSRLIEALESSGILANAAFKSPLTKGATPNTERFLLAAEVKPRPLPEPIPENALVAKPAVPGNVPAARPLAPAADGSPNPSGGGAPPVVTTPAPGPVQGPARVPNPGTQPQSAPKSPALPGGGVASPVAPLAPAQPPAPAKPAVQG